MSQVEVVETGGGGRAREGGGSFGKETFLEIFVKSDPNIVRMLFIKSDVLHNFTFK